MKIAYLMLAAGCIGCGSASLKELKRVKSPDGKVQAILFEKQTHATVARTYIVKLQADKETSESLVLMDKVRSKASNDEPKLAWVHRDRIDILYDQAHIWEFINFWNSKQLDNYSRTIEVRLSPQQDRAIPEK